MPAETTGSQLSTQVERLPPPVLFSVTPSLGPSARANPARERISQRHVAFRDHRSTGGVHGSNASGHTDAIIPLPCEAGRSAGDDREAAAEAHEDVRGEWPGQVELDRPAEVAQKEGALPVKEWLPGTPQ